MKYYFAALLLSVLILIVSGPALALSKDIFQSSNYVLPENTDYFSVKEISTGSIDYRNDTLIRTPIKTYYEVEHLRHTKIDDSMYMVWNIVPVGLGHKFKETETEQTLAEWKMNYDPSADFVLSPGFTGKTRFLWSSFLGNEFILNYSYHYNENPKPSFWDISLKYSVFLVPLERWHLGAFFQPNRFIKGFASVSNSKIPIDENKLYSSGLWTELEIQKNLVLQLEGLVHFFEKEQDSYFAKYAVASSLGFYF